MWEIFPLNSFLYAEAGPESNLRCPAWLLSSLQPHSFFLLPALIHRRIQRRIVVHLELPVKFEATLATQGLLPETVQTADQVFALLLQNGIALAVPLGMALWSARAVDFLFRMEELERQDGEPVNHESGTF